MKAAVIKYIARFRSGIKAGLDQIELAIIRNFAFTYNIIQIVSILMLTNILFELGEIAANKWNSFYIHMFLLRRIT